MGGVSRLQILFARTRHIFAPRLGLISSQRTRSFLTRAARELKPISRFRRRVASPLAVGWRTNRFRSYDHIWQSRDFRLIADGPWLRRRDYVVRFSTKRAIETLREFSDTTRSLLHE